MISKASNRTKMRSILPLVFVALLVTASLSCSDDDSNTGSTPANVCSDPGRVARIEGALARVESTLQLNQDGTVSINQEDPDYPSLTSGDKAFGKAILDELNTMVQDGIIRVNQDLSTEWLIPQSSCSSHIWGETCNVSAGTTKDICIGLKSGEAPLFICSLIPVVSTACEIIEVVGAIPLEAEICPCSDGGEGSTFHVTWVDIAWFKCN